MLRQLKSLSLLLTLCSVPTVSYAQDDDARAFELFSNGRNLYNEGRYAQAVLAFEEAYRLSGRHELLMNVAGAEERAGNLENALDALARYQAYATPGELVVIERRKAMLEARLAKEGKAVAPAPKPEQPNPVAPAPTPNPAPKPTPTPSARGSIVPGMAMMGLGAAAVGVGAGLGVVSSGAKKRAEALCVDLDGARICPGQALKDLKTHRSTAVGADIGFVAGAALVGTGVVLIVTRRKGPKAASLTVGPRSVQISGVF